MTITLRSESTSAKPGSSSSSWILRPTVARPALLRAEFAGSACRQICAVCRLERTIGCRTGRHVTARFWLRRGDRLLRDDLRRGLRRDLGHYLGRYWRRHLRRRRSARPCRRHQSRRNNRGADARFRRHGKRSYRYWLGRDGTQARFGIDHRRHRRRYPVESQQHAAQRNRQHGTIDCKPHCSPSPPE